MFLLCWINTFPSVSIHGRYIRKKNTHTEIQFALLRFLDHNQRCIQTVGHPNYTMTGIEKPHRHTHKNKYTEQIHFYVGGRGQGLREPGRKGGGRGTGDAREKKGRQAQEKFKNASFLYLLLLTSSQRNEPNNVFRLLFNILRGLKKNFIGEKSQKTKIRNRDKKKKNTITSSEIGNLSKSLTS